MLLAVTPGEPAGIGPDIVLHAHRHLTDCVVIADIDLLKQRAQKLSLDLSFELLRPLEKHPLVSFRPGSLKVLHVPMAANCTPGTLRVTNASYVLECISQAVDGCSNGQFDGMVTGPVHKGIINEAGIVFSGHTEYIARRTNASPVMMLAVEGKRVALVTTHLPLSLVSRSITKERIERTVRIIDQDFRKRLNISRPRIAVCGLNPHAGEQGHLGKEEIEVITPVLEKLRAENLDIRGPLPADTLFAGNWFEQTDVALAMYHDQGLPVIKQIGFGNVVNITLGLPIIRTSVDHGTALELAGTGQASSTSFIAALEYARQLAQNNNSQGQNPL